MLLQDHSAIGGQLCITPEAGIHFGTALLDDRSACRIYSGNVAEGRNIGSWEPKVEQGIKVIGIDAY